MLGNDPLSYGTGTPMGRHRFMEGWGVWELISVTSGRWWGADTGGSGGWKWGQAYGQNHNVMRDKINREYCIFGTD